ncbi:MAG: hypothetical protein J3R72DRAFT_512534 [Linnemannia gamsii]|nr:MAG: hypothetical protein J3R72DRAFT_512534 [Linnemannia gamsii]
MCGPREIDIRPEFPSVDVLRSPSVQLAQELKRMYWQGRYAMLDQLKLQYERDLEQNASQDNTVAVMNMATSHDVVAAMDDQRPIGFSLSLRSDLSADENYLELDKVIKILAGLSQYHPKHDFILHEQTLHQRLEQLLIELKSWLLYQQLKAFLVHVGPKRLSIRKRGKANYLSPPRLTSTVAGTDYFLTEIRNTIKSPVEDFGQTANLTRSRSYASTLVKLLQPEQVPYF